METNTNNGMKLAYPSEVIAELTNTLNSLQLSGPNVPLFPNAELATYMLQLLKQGTVVKEDDAQSAQEATAVQVGE